MIIGNISGTCGSGRAEIGVLVGVFTPHLRKRSFLWVVPTWDNKMALIFLKLQ